MPRKPSATLATGRERKTLLLVGIVAIVVLFAVVGLRTYYQEAQQARENAERLRHFKADARVAVHSLDLIKAAIDVGVTYGDYGKRVADAKAAVDQFVRKWSDDPLPPARDSVSGAMEDFALALRVWGQRLKSGRWIAERHEMAPLLLAIPGVRTRLEPGDELFPNVNVIDLEPTQQILWASAGRKLSQARAIVGE